ncbi:unnamed protein product [Tenebrio molitor]|nr:unnamed protein product [Tenebrio molitor]
MESGCNGRLDLFVSENSYFFLLTQFFMHFYIYFKLKLC